MFVICVKIDGNGQVATNEWKRFTIPLEGNRLFRGTLRLKRLDVGGQRANGSPSLVCNVLELRAINSNQVLRFLGKVVFDSTTQQRRLILNTEDINLFVSNLYIQKDNFEMEYRTLSLRNVLQMDLDENVYPVSDGENGYPTIMTSNVEYINNEDAPGTGVYTVTASTTSLVGGEYRCFNRILTDSYSSAVAYEAGTGNYLGSTITDTVLGEWLQIKFPCTVYINSFKMYTRAGNTPKSVTIFALDDSDNLVIEAWNGIIPNTPNTWFTFPLDYPGNYRSLRFIGRNTYGEQRLRIYELIYAGSYNVEEPDELQLTFNVNI